MSMLVVSSMDDRSQKRFTCDRRVCQAVHALMAQAAGVSADFSVPRKHLWKKLAVEANKKNLGPFLYRSLMIEVPDSEHLHIEGAFRKIYLENLRRCMILDQEHARISAALDEKISWIITMKGVSLSRRIFGDPGVRVVRDVDLLIPKDQLHIAEQVLRDLG